MKGFSTVKYSTRELRLPGLAAPNCPKGRDKGKIEIWGRLTLESSHGSVTHAPNKLLICTLVNKPLTITRRNFSKVNMSLNHLPFELLGLILANIFPDEWNHYNSGREVLNLRTVCRRYSKRVF
jgi:hypothetical protein